MQISVNLPGDKSLVVLWKHTKMFSTFTADSFRKVYSSVNGGHVWALFLDGLLICKLPCDLVEDIFI